MQLSALGINRHCKVVCMYVHVCVCVCVLCVDGERVYVTRKAMDLIFLAIISEV